MNKFKPSRLRFVYVLILAMVAQMIFPFQQAPIRAAEEGKDLGSIFTFSFMKMDGADVNEGDLLDVSGDHEYTLQYDWDTEDQIVHAGDYASIQVPEAFGFDREWQDLPIKLSDGDIVGKYSLINGLMTFVFDEGIEEVTGVKNGYVGFGVSLKTEWFNDFVTKKIHFEDKVDTTLEITLKPEKEVTGVDKSGAPDTSLDAKEITWTVNYVNSEESVVSNVVLSDVLPAGLDLTEVINHLSIKGLRVGYDGSVTEVALSETIDAIALDHDNRTLTVGLGSVNPYEGYRLSYTTPITDYSKSSFTNDVHITSDSKELTASSTVNGLTRSDYIEKSGQYLGNDKIEWTIDVNKVGGTLSDAVIREELPTGLTLEPSSIVIERLTQSGSTWQGTLDEEKTAGATDFPIVLGALTSSDAYRIRFNTVIDYSLIHSGNYKASTTFENKAQLFDSTIEYGDDTASVTVTRPSILEKNGRTNVNYNNKTLTWTIDVNKAHHDLRGLVLEDIIPKGLSIEAGNINFYDEDNNAVSVDPSAITVTSVAEGTKVSIQLGDIGKNYRKIIYVTTLDDQHGVNGYNINAFDNQASLRGTGIDGTQEDTEKVTVANNDYGKSFLEMDYNQKTMKWRISIKPKRDALSALSLNDTFPNAGLILLPDSLVVKVGSVVLTKDTDYTLQPNTVDSTTGYQKGFILNFLNLNTTPINNDLTIEYLTSYDPEDGTEENVSTDQNYINKVHITGQTEHGITVDTTQQGNKKVIDSSWNSGKKSGRLISADSSNNLHDGWDSGYTRQIRWEVYGNYQEQHMGENIRMEDTIDYDGAIIPESIAVYEYSVASNGNTTIGNQLAASEYGVAIANNDKSVTVTFHNTVDKRYVLVYRTTVPEISLSTYKNVAVLYKDTTALGTFTGSINYNKAEDFLDKSALVSGTKVYTDDELTWNVILNDSLSIIDNVTMLDTMSEGLVYKEGSIRLTQYNKGQEELLKEGEDYTIQTATVDNKTQLSLSFLHTLDKAVHVSYVTVVVAETGQVNNTAALSGDKIETKSVESQKLSAQQFSYIGGDPTKGKIHVTKVDEDDKTIESSEASFKLWYVLNGDDYLFGNRVYTTTKGELDIVNLPLDRTYYLEEVTAPEGYEAIDQRIQIEVKEPSNKSTYSEDVTNKKIYGNIQFDKEDESGKALAGAVFGLYDASKKKIDEATSLSDGTVTFSKVPYGDYTIQELNAPEGYVKSSTVISVSIEKQGVTVTPTVDTITNKVIKGSILLKKEDTDGHALSKAEFGLYDAKNVLVDKATSDTSGIVSFEDVPYGSYTIKEILAPVGYVPSTDSISVTIKTDKQVVDLRSQPVENTQIVGDIEVVKQDAISSDPLKGAVFVLEQDGKVMYTSDPTDNQGRYVFDDVEYGTYTLKETKAPTGYLINTKTYSVTIKEQNAAIQRFVVPDTRISGHLQLTKTDDEGNRLKGATFTLYARTDTTYTTPLKTAVSDENGIVSIKDIDYGDYTLKETKAPEGYNLNTSLWNVEIRKEDETVIKADAVVNTRIIGAVRVLKRDRTTYNPLSGATIALYDASGTFLKELVSGTDGYVLFEQLEYGRYYYAEVSAPSGYVLDQTRYEVNVKEHGVTVQKTLNNRKRSRPSGPFIPVDPEDPETPETPDEPDDPDVPEVTETPENPEDLPDDDIPQDSTEIVPPSQGNEEDDTDVKAPGSRTDMLPDTGRTDRRYYDIIGMLLIATGWMFTRKKG